MIHLKKFIFNPLQVNTYLLYNDKGYCIIVDPANSNAQEDQQLAEFIKHKELSPVMLINTHCHVDHILGNAFVYDTWGLKPVIHEEGKGILEAAPDQAVMIGLSFRKSPAPEKYVQDGQVLELGDDQIEVRYTPGHAAGSICLVMHQEKILISGDVLFAEGVGRTDLPTGNMDLLQRSIQEKIMPLDENFTVYPGHGPSTTIGNEKMYNPFF
ncbi:MAG: MBL fold metallo-hydrolase [Bacteroidales bacterium]